MTDFGPDTPMIFFDLHIYVKVICLYLCICVNCFVLFLNLNVIVNVESASICVTQHVL